MDKILLNIEKIFKEEYYSIVKFNKQADEYGLAYCINRFYSAPRDLLNHSDAKIFFERAFNIEFDFELNIYNCLNDTEISSIILKSKNKKYNNNLIVFVDCCAGSYSDENYDAILSVKIYEDLSDEVVNSYKKNILNKALKKYVSDFSSNLRSITDHMSRDEILNIINEDESLNKLLNLNFNNNLKEELSEEIKSKPISRKRKKI